MAKPKTQSTTVLFDYHSAYNEIVNPRHFVSSTLYYVRHWLTSLGANGHMIVTVLRSHGYYDAQGGQHRDAVDIDQKALALECGMSLSTFQREFIKNPTLAKFVQREFVEVRDKAGRILRQHYVYRVKMDDPLTPEDQARFDALMEGKDKGECGEKPIGQIDTSAFSPIRQNDTSEGQNAVPTCQNDVPIRQNDTLYNESPTLNTLDTLATAAPPGVSLALFSEQEAVPIWSQLTETEQQPYRAQAEQELIAMVGLAEWPKLRASGRDRQVQARAETLYKAKPSIFRAAT